MLKKFVAGAAIAGAMAIIPGCGVAANAHAETVPAAPVAAQLPDPLTTSLSLSGGMLGGAIVGGAAGAGSSALAWRWCWKVFHQLRGLL